MAEIEVKKINDVTFEIPKEGKMHVSGRVFVSEKLLALVKKDRSLEQVKNVASLPGILKHSFAMPDMHMGYGFSIGGVAAFDFEEGIITPGGIGFDINCGVRLLATDLREEDIRPKIDLLLEELFKRVPCGVGKDSGIKLDDKELESVMSKGARWAVEKGYGNEDDLEHCESNGVLPWADPKKVSSKARARGRSQLGTLGAGNHFLEIQFVDEIYKPEVAEKFGIRQKGQAVIMIHCGSRGFGHQVCTDFLRRMEDEFPELINNLPEKDLAYAPFNSQIGQDYFAAMASAANFAWANRHVIGHQVRQGFESVFKGCNIKTVYDVAHNIAKIEEHNIDGTKRKVIVHRKGATRCFPAGHAELPKAYKKVGHPVLIPGSMGTASYVLVGTKDTMDIAFGSTAHGAGRMMSRNEAIQRFRGDKIKQDLLKKNIHIKSASWQGVSEEAPEAYKDIDEVVRVTQEAGISEAVARLRPIGVIKG